MQASSFSFWSGYPLDDAESHDRFDLGSLVQILSAQVGRIAMCAKYCAAMGR